MRRAIVSLIFILVSISLFSTPYSYSLSTIIIDAGHGGVDPGAVGEGLLEKDITLAIALRLQEFIEKESNLDVVLTRSDDSFISLEQRISISNSTFPGWNNSALFISIHVNGSTNSTPQGYEFLVRESKKNLSFISPLSANWAISYFANHSMSELRRELNQASYRAALSMREGFTRTFSPDKDRGVKEQNLYVTNYNLWPSVLIETGFVSNEKEATLMKDASWIDSVANSIWIGINQYML